MQVAGVDDVTHGLDPLDEFGEIVDHLFTLDDLGVAGKSGWKQALVYQWFKAHHDRVIWARERERERREHAATTTPPQMCALWMPLHE